jgi:diguanylate cyclase (GGDEF)-like protein
VKPADAVRDQQGAALAVAAGDARVPESSATGLRGYSLRSSLLLLVVLCVLPALAVAAYLVIANYRLHEERILGTTLGLARQMSAEVDRELASIESALRVLATAQSLRNGDLAAFHQTARDALASQLVSDFVVTDVQGRQLLNTLRPWGSPLPAAGAPAQLQRVFSAAQPVLTDMFVGQLTGRPTVAMGVPVQRGGGVVYSLNIGLSTERLSEILQRHALPEGWLVALLDGSGTIVARTQQAERTIGQKANERLRDYMARHPGSGSLVGQTVEGLPVLSSYQRGSYSGWTVVVGAPRAALQADLYGMLGILLIALLLFGVGLWLAWRLASRVLGSVQQLNDAALALGQGGPVALPSVQIREAEAVGQAILKAAELMAEVRHRAYHDALTGLANRTLFLELLQLQLSLAQREQGRLAVMAIDLDNFKTVNDEEGHARGDQLLQEVAARIGRTLRASDAAARSGGDEFWVMLCDADELSALETASRLLGALREPIEGIRTPVSASIGIAVYPSAGREPQVLLEAADHALYEAKRAGRNRLAVARSGRSGSSAD